MSNAWDYAKEVAEKHANQGGLFVRLQSNGDKVVGAFCDEPYAREVHWLDKYEDCQGEGCPPAEDSMKVIEGGVRWFNDVAKVREKYGLDKWLFEIERHGESGDSKTKYSILPEEKIDDATKAKIDGAELNNLVALNGGSEKSETPASENISAAVAGELVARLKVLPRTKVDEFLKKFNIGRVRELRAKDEDTARAFIADADSEQGVDPFA